MRIINMLTFALSLCTGWDSEQGGVTSYIAKDEDEEVMIVYLSYYVCGICMCMQVHRHKTLYVGTVMVTDRKLLVLFSLQSPLPMQQHTQLLSLSPALNALSLVYRDEDSLRFTKYINHRAVARVSETSSSYSENHFYTFAVLYKELKSTNIGWF